MIPCFRIWVHFPWFRHSTIPAFRVARDFLRNMHMKRKKETSQGLRKNMQLKMIFKDHIDCLSTGVRLNNNYDMVCGIIFFPKFYISDFIFETRTATGREHSVCQDSGVSQLFIVIIPNRETYLAL